jgi:hypothetical protein
MANKVAAALAGGAVGALTLTALHEILKRVTPNAPRVDNLAKQALRKVVKSSSSASPSDDQLHWASLAGDLVANTAYYAVGLGFGPGPARWLSPLLGAGAGIGSVMLPKPIGLDDKHTARTQTTQVLSVALYLAGSAAAALTYHALHDAEDAA